MGLLLKVELDIKEQLIRGERMSEWAGQNLRVAAGLTGPAAGRAEALQSSAR